MINKQILLCETKRYTKYQVCTHIYAVRTQIPPAALILSSACLEKNRAFTMTGCSGSLPFARTLYTPCLVQSIIGASFLPSYCFRTSSPTNDHSLSTLTVGQKYLFFFK